MILNYKHGKIGLRNLFGRSIALTLQKKLIFCPILGYHTLCYATPRCARFLAAISLEPFFSEPQNMSVI